MQVAHLQSFKKLEDAQVLEIIKKESLEKFLTFVPEVGNIFNVLAVRPTLLDVLNKRLSMLKKDSLPILLFKDHEGFTPLDRAI